MFTLEIETSNAAFGDDDRQEKLAEIARIIRLLADRLDNGQDEGKVHDINGNRVGTFELTDEKPYRPDFDTRDREGR